MSSTDPIGVNSGEMQVKTIRSISVADIRQGDDVNLLTDESAHSGDPDVNSAAASLPLSSVSLGLAVLGPRGGGRPSPGLALNEG